MTDPQPNPFSREGSSAADGLGARPEAPPASSLPTPPPAEQSWNPYPPQPQQVAPDPPAAGWSAYPAADPWGADQSQPAGYPASGAVYQPTYAGYSTPYGPGYYGGYPAMPIQHPRATPALVLGVLGLVLAMGCGIGGLVGIGGIVLGRAARNEIDAEPGRYTGRSTANAGFITGVVGVALSVVMVILVAAIASSPG
jgi:hypothetical protein